MKRRIIPLLVLVLACMCFAGAAEGNILKFEAQVVTLFEGETLQTVLTREGTPAEGTLTYESANAKIATVDENGLVTGVSKGDTAVNAVVKTEKQTFRARINVKVARKAETLQVNESNLTIHTAQELIGQGLLKQLDVPEDNDLPVLVIPVKKGITLQVTTLPKDATNRNLVLTAAEEGIIRINGQNVTGLAAGETILTIANQLSPEINVRYRVLVIQPVTRIQPATQAPVVAVGGQVTLLAEVQPADASIPQLTWSSASEAIATVDANGTVTGVKRGNVRIAIATTDGSNTRANINVKVVQNAEEISLDYPELTVDIGRNGNLKATVLPKDTDDKSVVWSSSDEQIAKVNNQGRVTGVSLGTCEITCASKTNPEVKATATVHIQQPVTKITFADAPFVYLNESAKVLWYVEPVNATNPAVKLTSSNPSALDVAADGTVTGLKVGDYYVDAVSTDGSNRRARLKIHVGLHVESAQMVRRVAYIDVGETAIAGATIKPDKASNKNIVWYSADTDIAKVERVAKQGYRVRITGVRQGETTVSGVTEDGGFPVSLQVKIGDWDHAIKLKDAYVKGEDVHLTVTNNSRLTITRVTAEVSILDNDGKAVPCNSKDNKSNTFKVVYTKALRPGESSRDGNWKRVDYKRPESTKVAQYVVRVTQYQIDNDWVKTIRKKNQPKKVCPVHL